MLQTLASCGRFFVSGASDEAIRVFNVEKMTDLGTLFEHTGSITALAFHQKSHLFSASEDGCICIWRTKDWEMLTSLKATEPVTTMAVHDSGRMLLASYKNRVIRMWDLVKGRCSWKKNLPQGGDIIVWGPSPQVEFAVAAGPTVTCYQDGEITFTLDNEAPVLSMVSVKEFEILICGTADGRLVIWSCKDGTRTAVLGAHTERIRSLQYHEADGACYLVTASSSGILKMWEVVSSKLLRMVQETQVDCRLTAMCLLNGPPEKPKPLPKKKSGKSILKSAPTPDPLPKGIEKKQAKKKVNKIKGAK